MPFKTRVRLGLILLVLVFLLQGCASQQVSPETEPGAQGINPIITRYTEAAKRLDAFLAPELDLEEKLEEFGDFLSPEYFEREKALLTRTLEELKTIQPNQLSQEDKIAYLLFKENLETSLERYQFPWQTMVLNQMSNRIRSYIDESNRALTSFPFDTYAHYEAYLRRSAGFPAYIENQMRVLKEGLRKNIALNCTIARKTRNTYVEALEPVIEKNPFWRPFLSMPKSFTPQERASLEEGFRRMIDYRIVPTLQAFDQFFVKEYLPHCRKTYGIGELPRGKRWYRYLIKAKTGLSMNPQRIHEIGLKEVNRIAREMDVVRKSLGFTGTRRQFVKSLVQDPKYFFKRREEMIGAFQKVKSEISRRIPDYFTLLPKTDYQVVETGNPEDAAASYKRPTETVPQGRFVVNTKNLRSIPIYEVTTLSLHEAIPGHHYEDALIFEMKDKLSEYRRKLYESTAFSEGWALYAEYLGREMGLYFDPLQKMGNLNSEMLRAVRLVVDTGIHSLGWSREKAIAYMVKNLASDRKDIEAEADRYSVWPGQALAYKLGQLKILELRKLAEKELKTKFKLREFHRVVIGNGTVSLSVLEILVKDWIHKSSL